MPPANSWDNLQPAASTRWGKGGSVRGQGIGEHTDLLSDVTGRSEPDWGG